MFAEMLTDEDALRADAVVNKVLSHGFPVALTGGLAIEAHVRAHGRPSVRRPLNDLDFVVEGFSSIPASIAGDFLLHHVHPFAAEGKTLVQLVDASHAVRVDLFRAFGRTMSRGTQLDDGPRRLQVVSVEDLVARTTAYVYGRLLRGRFLDPKHTLAFRRLSGLGIPGVLDTAWRDHREDLPIAFAEAAAEAARLLESRPDLIVRDEYSQDVTPCDRCQIYGPFRPAPPASIIGVLGYW